MANTNRTIELGDNLGQTLITGNESSPAVVSKYLGGEDTEGTYGKSALFLTELEREIGVNVAEGIRYKAIANLLDMDERIVKTIANRKHVRKFITEYVEETTAVLKAKREMYLAQIIEARLDKVQDMAHASDLDTATLIAMLDSVQKEKEKAALQKGNQNQVVNVLQMITKEDK